MRAVGIPSPYGAVRWYKWALWTLCVMMATVLVFRWNDTRRLVTILDLGMNTTTRTDRGLLAKTKTDSGKNKSSPAVTSTRPPLILLLTYLRAGSTFTAEIIEQAPNVFYLYEPLWPFLESETLGTGGVCNFLNNSCRNPRSQYEKLTFAVQLMKELYHCNIAIAPPNVKRHFRNHPKSLPQLNYKKCLESTIPRNCIYEMEEQCSNSLRLFKTIRLRADAVKILMDELPALKVVHLLRDPRAMANSRIRGNFIDQRHMDSMSKASCKLMLDNIHELLRLQVKHPGRIRTLVYERLAEDPHRGTEALYDFLGLDKTLAMYHWLYEHTQAGNKFDGYYSTMRSNSSEVAYAWRYSLTFKDVQKIDRNCQEFYRIAGFKDIKSENDLINSSYSTRTLSPIFGDYF